MDIFDIISNFSLLLIKLVISLWQDSSNDFLIAFLVGVLVSGIIWWLSSLLAYSFNRQFSFHARHHIYCGIAATITFCFTIIFFALHYTEDVAGHMVKSWGQSILVDGKWGNDTFRKAYDAVYELRDASGKQLENFSQKSNLEEGGSLTSIPTNHNKSKQVAAETYAEAMVEHFQSTHGFLSLILWANPEDARKAIYADMKKFFATGARTYMVKEAIQLAEKHIRNRLEEQLPRVVLISRVTLVIIFLLIQAITLLLLIRAALADIKEK